MISEDMVIDAEHIPTDVVRLHLTITVTGKPQWQETFILITPSEKEIKRNKTYVKSILGLCIIGPAEEYIISYGVQASGMSLKIKMVGHWTNKTSKKISKKNDWIS